MSNTFLQIGVTSGRSFEGVDVEDIDIIDASKVRLRNVRANRIRFIRNCRDIEIDGFRLTGRRAMPLMAQAPAFYLQGLHLCNGYIDCAEALDTTGDLQAISFRAALMESISIHDIWINNHCRNALAMYKQQSSKWRDIDVHHLYVTNGRDISNSGTAGALHFGSDADPGHLAENCRVHDCLVRDTAGFGVRHKNYGMQVSNILGPNEHQLYGSPNPLGGETAEDIHLRVIMRTAALLN
ncbi:MAG: hypothetical protein AB1560_02090 [Pseudomonadota bacterium]